MSHFEQELADLKEKLLTMGAYAEASVRNALKAFEERDDDLARKVREGDDILDRFEKEVDEMAIALLSKAPLATDLRFITVTMKISHNLERVGDEARAISRRAIDLNREPPLKTRPAIPRMAAIAIEMLKDVLDAFTQREPEKARIVIQRDEEVDAFNKELRRELSSCMAETPETIARCLNLMTIAKRLERIADHATNIGEDVVFLYEGRDIRHTGKDRTNVVLH